MSSQTNPPPPGQTVNEAATQEPAPRVIDENTDMSTLTDQEIMRLMEGMDHNSDALSKVGAQQYRPATYNPAANQPTDSAHGHSG